MDMKEKVLDIWIDWDTLQITAHIEGEDDPMKCKEEILEFLKDIGDFDEGKFTIVFKSDGGGGAKQTSGTTVSHRRTQEN